MTTELFIENHRLDINADISALLTFAIDDVKDFSSRSTTWSKTIVLPGTANNNKIFGHIFQPGQSNGYNPNQDNVGYNFNAAKSADCIIFQDNIQAFKGVLRLLQVNNFQGRPEYEVSVFGKLTGLNISLSGMLLENLDFSPYNHVFNDATIVASWDNPGGTGYYYPLIDYGTYSVNKHDWDIRTFRPAVYAYELIDKMFDAAGFRWNAELFETPKFRSLIVPYNKKQLTALANTLYSATINTTRLYEVDDFSTYEEVPIAFDLQSGTGFTANAERTEFTYNSSIAANVTIDFSFTGNQDFVFPLIFGEAKIRLIKNDTQEIYATPDSWLPTPNPFTVSGSIVLPMAPSDKIKFDVRGRKTEVEITSGSFTATTSSGVPVPIFVGSNVTMNDVLPKNVRCIDFLVGIVKMFNLYVYEDKLDTLLIYLKPWINYYEGAHNSAVDWTYKLNRDKVVKVKPMSELNAKIYKFKFKSDSDYYNDLYSKRYGEGYGDRVYDSEFEFTDQTKEFEVVFSATPLVGYNGEDKVYSTIFKRTGPDNDPVEENTDSNIRILQSKKITGVTPWNITDGTEDDSPVLNTLTRYGYAGHFDDPDSPNDDLNFGVTRELFFTLVTGNLSNNQFNVYWSGYMAEITNKDSKLLSGSFYLTPLDIINLDFSKFVYLDGVLFRLNAIRDYNASKPADCQVELLKVNYTNFTEASPPEGPPEGNFLLWSNENVIYFDDVVDGNELNWSGPSVNPIVNYSFDLSTSHGGFFRIYLNSVQIVSVFSDTSGALSLNDGDIVRVEVKTFPAATSIDLVVDSDVDGGLYNQTGTTSTKVFQWTVSNDQIYTVTASSTI